MELATLYSSFEEDYSLTMLGSLSPWVFSTRRAVSPGRWLNAAVFYMVAARLLAKSNFQKSGLTNFQCLPFRPDWNLLLALRQGQHLYLAMDSTGTKRTVSSIE